MPDAIARAFNSPFWLFVMFAAAVAFLFVSLSFTSGSSPRQRLQGRLNAWRMLFVADILWFLAICVFLIDHYEMSVTYFVTGLAAVAAPKFIYDQIQRTKRMLNPLAKAGGL